MKYYLHLADGVVAAGIAPDGTLPPGAVECTVGQYTDAANWTISGGAIVPYVPPALPLVEQAINALEQARRMVWNDYGSLGQAVPTPWINYQTALRAIATGADTSASALPAAPSI